jgi:hypothetical protein
VSGRQPRSRLPQGQGSARLVPRGGREGRDRVGHQESAQRHQRTCPFRGRPPFRETLPTIEDYQKLEEDYPDYDPEILGLRNQIRVPFSARIELTKKFNADLATRCAAMGIRFIDTTAEQLDPATQRVRAELVAAGVPSIHLDTDRYAALLSRMLRERGYPR